ncbi:MAG: hypothetical protein H0U75_05750 [Legionella sp.]|nr:hypothetical protein [Legionella sp.]
MSLVKNTFLMLLLFCFCTVNATVCKTKNIAFRSFWHPFFQCNRLAYCDESACGKPVADHYCQLLGYDYSQSNTIAYHVGLTHSLTNRVRCTGWGCDGFMEICCARDLNHNPPRHYHYREQAFVVPRFNDYRVDWCYKAGCGCGARAANAFCTHLGYLKAKHYEKECQVQATKTIGSQQLCFGDHCNAFKLIVCYR